MRGDRNFKHKTNKTFDSWKFTFDGKFDKCPSEDKKLRRRNQRALEKRRLNKLIKSSY